MINQIQLFYVFRCDCFADTYIAIIVKIREYVKLTECLYLVSKGGNTLDSFSVRFRVVVVFSLLTMPFYIRGNKSNLFQPIAQAD